MGLWWISYVFGRCVKPQCDCFGMLRVLGGVLIHSMTRVMANFVPVLQVLTTKPGRTVTHCCTFSEWRMIVPSPQRIIGGHMARGWVAVRGWMGCTAQDGRSWNTQALCFIGECGLATAAGAGQLTQMEHCTGG